MRPLPGDVRYSPFNQTEYSSGLCWPIRFTFACYALLGAVARHASARLG